MAFPTPSEFALKATSSITSADWLAFPQPQGDRAYEMLRVPRLLYIGGGGAYVDGYDGVRLHWPLLSQDQFKVLSGWVSVARDITLSNAGRLYCRYWEEQANDGDGGFVTVRCWPLDPVGQVRGLYYHQVTMDWMGLGAP